jgi:hypothetical protein
MWVLYKDSHLARNNLFYKGFIFWYIEKYQQKYQQKTLLPPKKPTFTPKNTQLQNGFLMVAVLIAKGY